MNRKIIQIQAFPVPNHSGTQCNYMTVALCDDGTVWESADTRPEWRPYGSIPDASEPGTAVEILAASFPGPMTTRDTEILANFREKVTALESDATFWREMFVRAKCGCFAKDCTKHGSYDPNAVTKASLILRYS